MHVRGTRVRRTWIIGGSLLIAGGIGMIAIHRGFLAPGIASVVLGGGVIIKAPRDRVVVLPMPTSSSAGIGLVTSF